MPRPIVTAPRRLRSLAAGAILALAATACGSSAPAATPSPVPIASRAPTARPTPVPMASPSPRPTPSPTESAAAEIERNGRIEVADSGYAITLPKNWFRVELTADDLKEFARAGSGALGTSEDEKLAQQIASLAASRISFFALRFADSKAPLGTSVNVAVVPSLGLDLDTLETLNVGQLQSVLGKDVKIAHTRVKLPSGEAVRLAYAVTNGGTTFALIQHLLVGSGKQFVISCGAPTSVTKIVGECDGIAKSIELLP